MVTFPIVERGDLERVALQALKTLDAITPGDLPRVGGKAFNCARLKQAGFPVPDGLVINAGRGLGEALVSGLIDPDEFRIHKRDATVLSARIGSTGQRPTAVATLSASQLAELGALVTRIEQHYGMPQDIEWCHD